MAMAEFATLEDGQRADLHQNAQAGSIDPPVISTDEAANLAGVGTATIKCAKEHGPTNLVGTCHQVRPAPSIHPMT